MITFDRYTVQLGEEVLDLYFYFGEGGSLLRSSFGPAPEFADATYRSHPQFIKDFTRFLKGEKPFDNTLLRLQGTVFQRAVWKELLRLRRGQTLSYGEIAERIHRPRAYRAVGSAVGKNPYAVIVPCHRVLHSGEKKVGKFGGGEAIKKALLENEGVFLPGDDGLQ